MFKKSKFIIGITLIVQSVTFITLFFVLLSKEKKKTAGAFLSLGAIGGVVGSWLLFCEYQSEQTRKLIENGDYDDFYAEDDLFEDCAPEDINCSIEEDVECEDEPKDIEIEFNIEDDNKED